MCQRHLCGELNSAFVVRSHASYPIDDTGNRGGAVVDPESCSALKTAQDHIDTLLAFHPAPQRA